jgi:hypothetical protein
VIGELRQLVGEVDFLQHEFRIVRTIRSASSRLPKKLTEARSRHDAEATPYLYQLVPVCM